MIRLACILDLIAIAALVQLVIHLDGTTATIFSFVGLPALGLALLLYVIARWREGGFRLDSVRK